MNFNKSGLKGREDVSLGQRPRFGVRAPVKLITIDNDRGNGFHPAEWILLASRFVCMFVCCLYVCCMLNVCCMIVCESF